MACLRHTTRKSVIPFLPSRLAERPLRRPVTGQSSHLERLHHHLHKEQEHRRQELEQQGSSSSPQQEVESVRRCSPVPPLEAPPAPPLGILAVTEPPESLGPPTVVLVQWTLDNPVDAHNHLTSSVFVSLSLPKSVSPVTQILQHIRGTIKRK
jgi:hypothetical protein